MTSDTRKRFLEEWDRLFAEQREYRRTYNGHPVQQGPIEVRALVGGLWQYAHCPDRTSALLRVADFVAWGASCVKIDLDRDPGLV